MFEQIHIVQYNLSIVELLVAGKSFTNHRFSTIQLVLYYIKQQLKQKICPLFAAQTFSTIQSYTTHRLYCTVLTQSLKNKLGLFSFFFCLFSKFQLFYYCYFYIFPQNLCLFSKLYGTRKYY